MDCQDVRNLKGYLHNLDQRLRGTDEKKVRSELFENADRYAQSDMNIIGLMTADVPIYCMGWYTAIDAAPILCY